MPTRVCCILGAQLATKTIPGGCVKEKAQAKKNTKQRTRDERNIEIHIRLFLVSIALQR